MQSHLDQRTVRAVALQATSGLARHVTVEATGGPVSVPVGDAVLGRLIDVTGTPGDGGAVFAAEVPRRPIHRAPPSLEAQSAATKVFETGIKVLDSREALNSRVIGAEFMRRQLRAS